MRRATAVPPEAGDAPAPHMVNLSESVVLKAGNVFAVTRRDGSLPVSGSHPLGLYRDDCRFLRAHELRVGGARPRLLVASGVAGAASTFEALSVATV